MPRAATLALLAALLCAGCTVTVGPAAVDEDAPRAETPAQAFEPVEEAPGEPWSIPEVDKRKILLATGLDDTMVTTPLFAEGFESQLGAWELTGATATCDAARTGLCSLALRGGQNEKAAFAMPAPADGTIEARFAWLGGGRGSAGIVFLDAEGSIVGPRTSEAPSGAAGEWTDSTIGPVSVPEGAAIVRLVFYGGFSGEGVDRIDDVELVRRTLPAGGFANGDFASTERWGLQGGARIDCATSYEGSCSLLLPREGGMASQVFVLGAPGLMLDMMMLPSVAHDDDLNLHMGFHFYDAEGRWVGSTTPSGSGFPLDTWFQQTHGASSSRAHHVLFTIAAEPNDAGELWIDAIQARYG